MLPLISSAARLLPWSGSSSLGVVGLILFPALQAHAPGGDSERPRWLRKGRPTGRVTGEWFGPVFRKDPWRVVDSRPRENQALSLEPPQELGLFGTIYLKTILNHGSLNVMISILRLLLRRLSQQSMPTAKCQEKQNWRIFAQNIQRRLS